MIILNFILLFVSVLSSLIRPILCGEVWRRCFPSLTVKATPIRHEAAKFFTSSYDNFIQTAGIRDGASHFAKVLSVFYDNLSDPNDPEVIIKIDVSNAFNSTDRPFTLDCISGRASRDYACGLKQDDVIGTVDSLTNLFGYLKAMGVGAIVSYGTLIGMVRFT
jgi:hypothetical protein